MYGIRILKEEHQTILVYIELVRKSCIEILEGKEVDLLLFEQFIDFGRNYADKHHHGKEEKILFRVMTEQLGTISVKLIQHGMLVEHDLGRLHLSELEHALADYAHTKSADAKLAIITNASGYGALLTRHIEKEDEVVFSFGEKMLNDASKEIVNQETLSFEQTKEATTIKKKYEDWLTQLCKNR